MAEASTEALLTVFVTGIIGLALWYSYFILWIRPQRLREKLRSQGIHGPPPSFLRGNILETRRILQEQKLKQAQVEGSVSVTADYSSSIFPYLAYWKKKYGMIEKKKTKKKKTVFFVCFQIPC